MEKLHLAEEERTKGDTAVDGLIAGVAAGLVMALFLALAGFLSGTEPQVTMGYFDPAQAGDWRTGLLGHLAVSAIYGVVFALLMRLAVWIRPSFFQQSWLWGIAYGLVLHGLATGVMFTTVATSLTRIAAWQIGAAHLLYGLVLSLWLLRSQ